ncbi:hypothetical protein BD311DRAFT_565790 [Dichomitus squalens]|uniref:Uncharacterized protein n=1 Tax=Dichomitus squalens TaxID=114155 RepID=A0A4V2JZA2_9APHY|nr:hypothetical protein BD311DRAFT_565790 [Dichomitus squalens]
MQGFMEYFQRFNCTLRCRCTAKWRVARDTDRQQPDPSDCWRRSLGEHPHPLLNSLVYVMPTCLLGCKLCNLCSSSSVAGSVKSGRCRVQLSPIFSQD